MISQIEVSTLSGEPRFALTVADDGQARSGRGRSMWAQLIKMRLKPGKDMAEMNEQIKAAEQPGSGLVRTLITHDQNDPRQVYVLVVFESEEKARAREQDPRREERLKPARATMADVLEGPPEFVDLSVVEEWTG